MGDRGLIRQWRAARSQRLAVLDDDPTGSQAVHGVEVVTVLDDAELEAALRSPSGVAFVLTNTRGLPEDDAVRLTRRVVGMLEPDVDIVSRSDSTLRGHLVAEVAAITAARPVDGVLLAPAYFEAGRYTEGDVHYATIGGRAVPVGETEFARDATFGYASSDLREFIAEKSGGGIRPDEVLSVSLEAIREGGPDAVRDVLLRARHGAFVIVNGTRYEDYETVVLGVQAAIDAGSTFLFRTGPSFVRSLAGIEPQPPLADSPAFAVPRGHGLVVVGSHVGQTTRQVAAARQRGGLAEVELDVRRLLAGDSEHVRDTTEAVRVALRGSDVLLYTSRDLVTGADAGDSLRIARAVSGAVSSVVAGCVAARPAWVVAKGGITSHDVAVSGLGIRRARVLGQLLPGQVSVLEPVSAPPGVLGMPYIVFAGNVGGDEALADVIAALHGAAGR